MPLSIPSLTLPSGIVVHNAYGRITGLNVDTIGQTGRVVLSFHPTSGDAGKPPCLQIEFASGQAAGPGTSIATLAQLMGDASFAAAYNLIAAKLYQESLKLSALAGGTVV